MMFDLAVTHVWELWLSSFSLPQVLRGKPDGALYSADVVFHCRKQQVGHFPETFPLRKQNSCWTWKTVSWREHAKCITGQDPFPIFIKLKWERITQSGPTTVWFWTRLVSSPGYVLTWFILLKSSEIRNSYKGAQIKKNKSQIKHPPCACGCLEQAKYLPETRNSSLLWSCTGWIMQYLKSFQESASLTTTAPLSWPMKMRLLSWWYDMQEHGAEGAGGTASSTWTPVLHPSEHWSLTYMKLCGRCWASTDHCLFSAKHGWSWGKTSDMENHDYNSDQKSKHIEGRQVIHRNCKWDHASKCWVNTQTLL